MFALAAAHDDVLGRFEQLIAHEGVSFLQALVLITLFFEERPLRPTELAKQLNVKKPNMSHALRGLERAGCVERSMTGEDARVYLFSLTSEGFEKATRLVGVFDSVQTQMEQDARTQSLNQSLKLLRELFQNVEIPATTL